MLGAGNHIDPDPRLQGAFGLQHENQESKHADDARLCSGAWLMCRLPWQLADAGAEERPDHTERERSRHVRAQGTVEMIWFNFLTNSGETRPSEAGRLARGCPAKARGPQKERPVLSEKVARTHDAWESR